MHRFTLCLLSMLPLFAGCRGYDPLGMWYGPHREPEVQRHQAQMVDPYPVPEAGPEIVGGRPRDFQVPRTQTQQIQPDRGHKFGW